MCIRDRTSPTASTKKGSCLSPLRGTAPNRPTGIRSATALQTFWKTPSPRTNPDAAPKSPVPQRPGAYVTSANAVAARKNALGLLLKRIYSESPPGQSGHGSPTLQPGRTPRKLNSRAELRLRLRLKMGWHPLADNKAHQRDGHSHTGPNVESGVKPAPDVDKGHDRRTKRLTQTDDHTGDGHEGAAILQGCEPGHRRLDGRDVRPLPYSENHDGDGHGPKAGRQRHPYQPHSVDEEAHLDDGPHREAAIGPPHLRRYQGSGQRHHGHHETDDLRRCAELPIQQESKVGEVGTEADHEKENPCSKEPQDPDILEVAHSTHQIVTDALNILGLRIVQSQQHDEANGKCYRWQQEAPANAICIGGCFLLPSIALPVGFIVLLGLDNPEPENVEGIRDYLVGAVGYLKDIRVLGLFAAGIVLFIILFGTCLTYFTLLLDREFGAPSQVIGLMMSVMLSLIHISEP